MVNNSSSGKERQRIINNNLRRFVAPLRKHHMLNGHNKGNSSAHEKAKFCKAIDLERDGNTVLIEPILLNGFRPDLLIIDTPTPVAVEIVCSETKDSISRKVVDYPFNVIFIDVNGEEL